MGSNVITAGRAHAAARPRRPAGGAGTRGRGGARRRRRRRRTTGRARAEPAEPGDDVHRRQAGRTGRRPALDAAPCRAPATARGLDRDRRRARRPGARSDSARRPGSNAGRGPDELALGDRGDSSAVSDASREGAPAPRRPAAGAPHRPGRRRRPSRTSSSGDRVLERERAARGPAQRAEVGGVAQRLAEVAGERADVRARRARDLDDRDRPRRVACRPTRRASARGS